MMFGLQGAPGVFQELMEILSTKCKQDKEVRDVVANGHLASFFDDTGIGGQTRSKHFRSLEKYFQVCVENNVRIKLSKCEFFEVENRLSGIFDWMGKMATINQIRESKPSSMLRCTI